MRIKKREIGKATVSIIGLYQIVGGSYGLFGLIHGIILEKSEFTVVALIICFAFGFSIYAGVTLLTGDYMNVRRLTLINQAIQIVKIKLIGIGYEYVAGSYFAIGFTDTPSYYLQYKYAFIKGTCLIWPGTDNEITVMINLVPIILIIVTTRLSIIMNKELNLPQ